MLRLIQRVDDLSGRVEVDRHIDRGVKKGWPCTSYEQGMIGAELWAVRHQERLREALRLSRAR